MTNSNNDGQSKNIVATDVGGACTDVIVIADDEQFFVGKALSTPPNFANGVMDSIGVAAENMGLSIEELFAQSYLFRQGSTVVDNTLLTRDGFTVGLITTAGFEDTLLVTRSAYGRWAGQPEEWIKHPVATDRPSGNFRRCTRWHGRGRYFRFHQITCWKSDRGIGRHPHADHDHCCSRSSARERG